MRAPDARNTATVVGAAAAALIAASPLLGAPTSAAYLTPMRDDRVALIADGHLLGFGSPSGILASRGQTGVPGFFARAASTDQFGRIDPTGAGAGGYVLARAPLSPGARLVAFTSWAFDSNCRSEVFVLDRARGLTERVSVALDGGQANGSSWDATLSANGRYVSFSSTASNLVADDTDGVADRFQRNLETQTTRLTRPLATARPAGRPIPVRIPVTP